jgi:site-specific DNA recombinase
MGIKLRFAPLVRVSTEKQAKRGESLRTQKDQILHAVEILGGDIYKWYEGQEHASPDFERKILEQLIYDAKAKKFDAVIVTDLSRWSRDNAKSKQYIKILKEADIRFYELSREIDLYDPTGEFILGIGIEVAEFFTNQQKYKSIINRIHRAKQGNPSCGKLPYGRTYDKNKPKGERWSVNEEELLKVHTIARLYLEKDISFQELGKKFGMNPTNLRKILINRSGIKWEQRFISKKLILMNVLQLPYLLSCLMKL